MIGGASNSHPRRCVPHEETASALEKIGGAVPYIGLWTGKSHIGNFKAIHSIDGLQPELLRYLGAIHDFWSALPEDS